MTRAEYVQRATLRYLGIVTNPGVEVTTGAVQGCGEVRYYTDGCGTLLGPVRPDPRAPNFRSPSILWCAKHERHYDERNGCGACRA